MREDEKAEGIRTDYWQASKFPIFHTVTLGSKEERITVKLAVCTWKRA